MLSSRLPAFVLAAVLAVPLAAAAHAAEAPPGATVGHASAGTVHEVRFAGDTTGLDEEALRRLLSVRPGGPYDGYLLRDSLATLYQTGRFDAIDVRLSETEAGVADVTFDLKRARVVTGWSFSGCQVLPEEALERVLELTWGQRFDPDQFARWERLVHDRYAREGLPHASVAITPVARDAGRVELRFTVREGAPVRIRKVLVTTAGGLAEGEVRRLLDLSRGERLTREGLAAAVERLESRLGAEGWVNGRVRWAIVLPDGRREHSHAAAIAEAPEAVDVAVVVQEGRPATVEVDGDVLLPEAELAKAITIYERHSVSPFELDASAARIRDLYVSRGYPEVRVAAEIAKQDGERYRVRFRVLAGPRVRVRAVRFEGNEAADAPTLQRLMTLRGPAGPLGEGSPFDPAVWEEDLAALQAWYVAQGYQRARVVGVRRDRVPGGTDVQLTIVLEEGPRTGIGRIEFPGLLEHQKASALQAIGVNPGDGYNPARTAEWVAALQAYMAREGFPLARVAVTLEPGAQPEDATLRVAVTPGPRKMLGRVVVRGNLKTQDAVVQRQITFRPGDQYNGDELVATQQRIYQLGFFDRVTVEPMRSISPDPAEPIDLLVVLHERETGWVGVGGGYGSLQGPQASAEFLQNNMWGSGRPLRVEGMFSVPRTTLAASLRDPHLWAPGQIGEVGFTFLRERRREGEPLYQTFGPTVGLSRPLGDTWLGSLRYAWGQTTYPALTPEQVEAAAALPERINSIFTAGLTNDSRSDVLNPRWGSKLDLGLDLATPLLGGRLVYARPRLTAATYFPLPRRVVLAFGVEGGYVLPFGGTAALPTDLLFVTGGASTLRGYFNNVFPAGQPQGGRLMVVSHAEARVPVWGDVGLVAFFDAGNVWEGPLTVFRDGVRLTGGLGLRYNAPVGPARIDYGARLWPDFQPGNWEGLYMGLGHAF
ncbi:MAG: POTRA domain-containing protein [Candidatus Sericytochromatia bacterium]|nr:POTRA domain-containing protein [Candidatus Sericytochromatia bacterium]